jgi:hypothetical protein
MTGFISRQFLSKVCAFFLLALLIYCNISFPNTHHGCDFLPNFYIAGRLAREGNAEMLYPHTNFTADLKAPYNEKAHQYLDYLGKSGIFFRYPPLIAYLSEILSYLTPAQASLLWLLLSLLSLFLCSLLFSYANRAMWPTYFCNSLLFFPVLHVLLIGQVALVWIVLPLTIGYFMLKRQHAFKAGLVWSLLFLKPQFLPAILLFVITSILAGKLRCMLGFVLGLSFLVILNIVCFGPHIFHLWLTSLTFSGNVFLDPSVNYKPYLLSSLPLIAAQLLSFKCKIWYTAAIVSIDLLALGLFIHAVFISRRLWKTTHNNETEALAPILILGISLLPLISPHLLLYDLSIFIVSSMIIFSQPSLPGEANLRKTAIATAISINLFMLLFCSCTNIAPPLILLAILMYSYWQVLNAISKLPISSSP